MNISVLDAIAPAFMRCLGSILFFPLSGGVFSLARNLVIAIGMTLFFFPQLQVDYAITWYGLIAEFFIGLLIGLPASLTVDAARCLGDLFDNQRGLNFASQYDVTVNSTSLPAGILSAHFCSAMLFCGGIMEQILSALNISWKTLPLLSIQAASMTQLSKNSINFISMILSGMLSAFLLFAVLFCLVDLCSVFLARVIPGTALHSETFQVKSFLGFLAVMALLQFNLGPMLQSCAAPQLTLFTGF